MAVGGGVVGVIVMVLECSEMMRLDSFDQSFVPQSMTGIGNYTSASASAAHSRLNRVFRRET